MMGPKINQKIIRAYDIRGIVGKDLTTNEAYKVGIAFGQYIRRSSIPSKVISVCKDARHSGEILKPELIRGILDSGCDVYDVPDGPTPLCYFAAQKTLNAIMVTGSHNPPEYNGFKFVFNCASFDGEKIKKMAEQFDANLAKENGNIIDGSSVYEEYISRILMNIKPCDKKIIFDSLNGAGGHIAKRVATYLGTQNIAINSDNSGDFSTIKPDPTRKENLKDILNIVHNYDFGIAFDGDADRIVLITQSGKIVQGDTLMMLLARELIESGDKVIFDVKCSQNLHDEIVNLGGVPIMYKTGHSFIKSKLREENAVLAGEMSGHIYISKNYYGFDDAIYAAIILIKYLSSQPESLDAILDAMPKTFSSEEIKIHCDDKFEKIERIRAEIVKMNIEYNDIDGVRASFEDGWFLIRASNTEEILVVRYESKSQKGFDKIQNFVDELLK